MNLEFKTKHYMMKRNSIDKKYELYMHTYIITYILMHVYIHYLFNICYYF